MKFVVVQLGDTPSEIHAAVGFPITWDQADQPSFEWIHNHERWFELAYILIEDLGMLVFVDEDPGTDTTLHFNSLTVADRPNPTRNKT